MTILIPNLRRDGFLEQDSSSKTKFLNHTRNMFYFPEFPIVLLRRDQFPITFSFFVLKSASPKMNKLECLGELLGPRIHENTFEVSLFKNIGQLEQTEKNI